MSAESRPVPCLHPPLEARWTLDLASGVVTRRPATDGATVVIVAQRRVLGVAAQTGKVLWEHPQTDPVSEIIGCDIGPVIALLGDSDDVELAAFRWNGEAMWRIRSGLDTGDGQLRGQGAKLIAVGVPSGRTGRQNCRVWDASSGALEGEFPCNGDPPDLVGEHFIYSTRTFQGKKGGLFAFDPRTKRARALLEVGNAIRAVADGIAVIDTTDDAIRFSRLIAIDLRTGKTLWEDEGGPNFALSAAGGQLACVAAVDDALVSMTLRDIATGRSLWTAESVKAEAVTPIIAGDCVLGCVPGERIDVYNRATGALVQTIDEELSIVLGGGLTEAGFVTARTRPTRVECFAGASA
jgi:outer membrane protein assembly factor BamB